MTRIRYLECGGRLISHQILCGKELVQIVIDLQRLEYHIETEDDTLTTGNANTLTSIKKKAKEAVKELGASFFSEIRNRGSTEKL